MSTLAPTSTNRQNDLLDAPINADFTDAELSAKQASQAAAKKVA
jgi:hypothetical protein